MSEDFPRPSWAKHDRNWTMFQQYMDGHTYEEIAASNGLSLSHTKTIIRDIGMMVLQDERAEQLERLKRGPMRLG
jgi:Mor family transcriptional regulator